MALVIKGSSSGQVTVDVPASAGTNTLTIPAESGNIITNSTTGTILQVVQSEIATTQNTTRINARKTRISGNNIDIAGSTDVTLLTTRGPIKVKRFKSRDVDWALQVFAGTAVQSLVGASSPTPPAPQGGFGGGTGNPTNRRGSGVRR